MQKLSSFKALFKRLQPSAAPVDPIHPCTTHSQPIDPFLHSPLGRTILGNAVHAVRTQCEVLDVGKYSNPSFGSFTTFWFRTRVFFRFLSISDVACLNCQPFLPIFSHFPLFPPPHGR